VFVVAGFLRGLEATLAVSGDDRVVLIHSLGAAENLENSSVPARTASLLGASLSVVQRRHGADYVSPELYLGTRVRTEGRDDVTLGLVRGVTPTAALVRRRVQITDGHWPRAGEVLVGRLAAAKLGRTAADLAPGRTLTLEGRSWVVCGTFAAAGSAFESELWCPLADLQTAMKRQDVGLVALTLAPGAGPGAVDEFCKARPDLELEATSEAEYYAAQLRHYGPVRALAWLVLALVAGAGVFVGLNTMYGAAAGRVRELATLQTVGFGRRVIALSLIQEATLLAAAATLLAAAAAVLVLNGLAVRFTMGAFALRIDSTALAVGCGVGLFLGVAGALPPAVRALRLPIAVALKAV
jgi:putative ABC transport system permease protein